MRGGKVVGQTVVPDHAGSARVVDATYLGRVFNACQTGSQPGTSWIVKDPHEPASCSS